MMLIPWWLWVLLLPVGIWMLAADELTGGEFLGFLALGLVFFGRSLLALVTELVPQAGDALKWRFSRSYRNHLIDVYERAQRRAADEERGNR